MASINTSWTAGAHGSTPLAGNGWFSFSVPVGVVGVAVGLSVSDTSTDPAEPTHGLLFETGKFRVIERGAARTAQAPYAKGDIFAIVRHGGTIYYCRGHAGQTYRYAGVPFALPGAVVYQSATSITTPVVLDAALRMGGDRVVGAALEAIGDGMSISFGPPLVMASEGERASVAISFEPMSAEAHNGRGASVAFEPPQMLASQGEHHAVNIAFEPMRIGAGYDAFGLNGASLQMRLPTAVAAGMSSDRAYLTMAAPLVAASSGTRAEVVVSFQQPRVVAFALPQPPVETGPRFTVGLPAFFGPQPGPQPDFDGVDEGMVISDETHFNSYVLVTDTLAATGEFMPTRNASGLAESTLVIMESLHLGGSTDLEFAAAAAEDALAADSFLFVDDALVASSEVDAQSESSMLLETALVAGEDAQPFSLLDLADELVADDALLAGGSADLDDELIAGEELLAGSDATLEDGAADTLVAWSEVEIQSESFALLESAMASGEQLFMKQPGLVAWVMNTDTGAVSWYDNWAFTSMAEVGGKVFAAGPDGLHVLGGNLDGTDRIDARVDFGYTEFGGYDRQGLPNPSDVKKRVPSFWFGYHADGELTATVETYGQGYGPYTYAMAPRAADAPRNSRVVPGKGLNARYWRISVANANGCAFEVHSIAAEVAASTRRL